MLLARRELIRALDTLRLCENLIVMGKSTLFIAILNLFLVAHFVMKVSATQSSARDLSRYDQVGPFTVSPMDTGTENQKIITAKIRGFIWEHWQQRRLGYAVVTFYSKEGDPSTSHMFVEPDKKGVWHLSVRIERKIFDRNQRKTVNRTDSYKAYGVERFPGKDSSLRFKDKSGNVIVEW
jgi:hypothetical protein